MCLIVIIFQPLFVISQSSPQLYALQNLLDLQQSLPGVLPNYPSLQSILKVLIEATTAVLDPTGLQKNIRFFGKFHCEIFFSNDNNYFKWVSWIILNYKIINFFSVPPTTIGKSQFILMTGDFDILFKWNMFSSNHCTHCDWTWVINKMFEWTRC